MKTTPLRSEEQLTPEDWKKIAIASVNQALEEDRDQAYTSLVKGIEGMRNDDLPSAIQDPAGFCKGMGHNQALNHILENVVKPLYGKE